MTSRALGRRQSGLHLLVVLELLQREDVLVEIFLELLVGVVDVELLEAVDLRGIDSGQLMSVRTDSLIIN